jgi:ABC-type cobalamin transport system ATPase subunit
MENVTMRMEGTKLIIEVDTTHVIGPSQSGKTMLVASSQGIAPTPVKGINISMSLFKKVQ